MELYMKADQAWRRATEHREQMGDGTSQEVARAEEAVGQTRRDLDFASQEMTNAVAALGALRNEMHDIERGV